MYALGTGRQLCPATPAALSFGVARASTREVECETFEPDTGMFGS